MSSPSPSTPAAPAPSAASTTAADAADTKQELRKRASDTAAAAVEEAGAESDDGDDAYAAQGYTPLAEGEYAAWVGSDDSDDEDDSEEDGGGDVNVDAIADQLLARMEAEYRRTLALGESESGSGSTTTTMITTTTTTAAAAAVVVEGGKGAVTVGDASAWVVEEEEQEQTQQEPPSPLPAVPVESVIAPLSAEREEQIRKVMEGIVLPDAATPLWAKDVDWESEKVQKVLAALRGQDN